MQKKWIILMCVLLPLIVGAQFKSQKSAVFKPLDLIYQPTGLFSGLLDPSKFHMSQSYSLSFLSYGKAMLNQGLYLNTLSYRFSNPLWMQVQIGYLHLPFGQGSAGMSSNGKLFLHRASVVYTPSEKFTAVFEYQSMPVLFSPYRSW